MNTQHRPINPTVHAMMDYGLGIFSIAAPSLIPLNTAAARLAYVYGAAELLFIGMTRHKLSPMPLMPMKIHALMEYPVIAGLLLVAWLTGAMDTENGRWLYFGIAGFALVLHFLTDFNAQVAKEPGRPDADGERDGPPRGVGKTV